MDLSSYSESEEMKMTISKTEITKGIYKGNVRVQIERGNYKEDMALASKLKGKIIAKGIEGNTFFIVSAETANTL